MLMGHASLGWDSATSGVTLNALLDGSLRLVEVLRHGASCEVVLRPQASAPRLSGRERSVMERIVGGASQKAVSYELGVALTTVSAHLRVGLNKLGIARWEQAVLAAAVVSRGGERARAFTRAGGEGPVHEVGGPLLSTRIELCEVALALLTEAEREVALLALDGYTNAEISRSRQVSPRTVANQLAAVFRKLRVHGRLELIRKITLGSSASPPDAADVRPGGAGDVANSVARHEGQRCDCNVESVVN
jgi:DNA-binding CsgD family transcriptional regulator